MEVSRYQLDTIPHIQASFILLLKFTQKLISFEYLSSLRIFKLLLLEYCHLYWQRFDKGRNSDRLSYKGSFYKMNHMLHYLLRRGHWSKMSLILGYSPFQRWARAQQKRRSFRTEKQQKIQWFRMKIMQVSRLHYHFLFWFVSSLILKVLPIPARGIIWTRGRGQLMSLWLHPDLLH